MIMAAAHALQQSAASVASRALRVPVQMPSQVALSKPFQSSVVAAGNSLCRLSA